MIRERYHCLEFKKECRDDIFYSLTPELRNILIFYDQMSVANLSKSVFDFLTKKPHHINLTVIYLLPNVYNKGTSHITISLYSHYNVVFRNSRDGSQFQTMA